MPDMKAGDASSVASISSSNSAASRVALADRANRSTTRVSGSSTQGASLDVWLLPMRGKGYDISTPFGNANALDKGVDLAAAEGTPFYAAHGGTVTLARWNGAYGYTVIIDAGNGVQLVYGHASQLFVHEGQKVNSGDLLALVGNTGYAFQPAVHLEIHVNGTAVNPVSYLSDHDVDLVHHKDSLS